MKVDAVLNKVPAGWYPDPEMGKTQRYWDGDEWTEYRAPLKKEQDIEGPLGALVGVGVAILILVLLWTHGISLF